MTHSEVNATYGTRVVELRDGWLVDDEPLAAARRHVQRPLRRMPADAAVLLADDQPDVLEALRLLLKAEGYHIETATSPPACWTPSTRAISTSC